MQCYCSVLKEYVDNPYVNARNFEGSTSLQSLHVYQIEVCSRHFFFSVELAILFLIKETLWVTIKTDQTILIKALDIRYDMFYINVHMIFDSLMKKCKYLAWRKNGDKEICTLIELTCLRSVGAVQCNYQTKKILQKYCTTYFFELRLVYPFKSV